MHKFNVFTSDGKLIPKNSTLGFNALFVGQDAKYFKNPEIFMPERYLTDNLSHNPFSYIPFSSGNSIGQKFALLTMKSTISKVLRSFKVKVAMNFKPTDVTEIILRPTNEMLLNFVPRRKF